MKHILKIIVYGFLVISTEDCVGKYGSFSQLKNYEMKVELYWMIFVHCVRFKIYVNITFWNSINLSGQAWLDLLLVSGSFIREVRKLILK